MPRVYFTISSISRPLFGIISDGYHKEKRETKMTKFRERVIFLLIHFKNVFRKHPSPQSAHIAKTTRSISPLVDPEFLAFATAVAEYLRKGYAVGHLGGAGTLVPYAECSLSPCVQNTISLDTRYVLSIAPHRYAVDVGDIPEYAQLLKLKSLTRDTSLSSLLNRLALWLYLFVQIHHYGWRVVLYHPETGDKKEMTSGFFSKFSPEMPL